MSVSCVNAPIPQLSSATASQSAPGVPDWKLKPTVTHMQKWVKEKSTCTSTIFQTGSNNIIVLVTYRLIAN